MKIEKLINNRIFIIFILPFFLGTLCVLSFQPFNFTLINFVTLPALFILINYVTKRSKNIYRNKPFLVNLFLIGYLFGFGYFISSTFWISYSLTFDESFKILIPFSLFLIPAFLGLFFAFPILIVGPYLKNNLSSILIFSSALSLTDFIRSKILSGFPWNLWVHSWSWFPEVLQILNLVGFFALNLIVITVFTIPAIVFKSKKKINTVICILVLALFFCNYIFGSYIINNNQKIIKNYEDKNENLHKIKIVSPNFDLKYNLSNYDIENLIKELIKYSEPDKSKETLFIWPEGVFTGFELNDIVQYKKLFESAFSTKHVIIFGANTLGGSNKYYNSLIAIDKDFKILYQYNKKKLVPFGEFLPLESLFSQIGLKKITQGYGSFSKGDKQKNFYLKNLNILPLICYEIIFTELTQKAEIKTNLIVNISEDAWFGDSIGPYQHFSSAIFRAIEKNTYVARATNKGVSAFINNKGIIISSLKPKEAGNIELNIPIINKNSKNKNDLIFFILLITYTIIFFTFKNKL